MAENNSFIFSKNHDNNYQLDHYINPNNNISINNNKDQIKDLNYKYINTTELDSQDDHQNFNNNSSYKINPKITNEILNIDNYESYYLNSHIPKIIEPGAYIKNPTNINNNPYISGGSVNYDPFPAYSSKTNISYNTNNSIEKDNIGNNISSNLNILSCNNNNLYPNLNENTKNINNNFANPLETSTNSNHLNSNLDKLLENLKNHSQELEGKNCENIKLREEKYMLLDTINNLEATCFGLREENERLCRKIEDYQQSNKEWEKTVTQINLSLNHIEENNQKLKKENEDLKNCLKELELKLTYHTQKDLAYEDNSFKLKKVQEEYEESIREYKNKQDEIRKNFEEKKKMLEEEYYIKEKELLNTIDDVNYVNKKLQRESDDVKKELDELKEKYKKGEEFLITKEKEFLELVQKKDNKLFELEKSLKIVSDEYEYEIIKLNKILKDKEEEYLEKINKKSSDKIDYEKELAEANLIIEELQSKSEFYRGKNNEYDQFCKDYDCKIQNLESQIENLNFVLADKEKIILEYEEKAKEVNEKKYNNFEMNNNNDSRRGYNREINYNNFNSTANSHIYESDYNSHLTNKTLNPFNSAYSNATYNIKDETEIIFMKNQIREKDQIIDHMRNKINELEKSVIYYQSYDHSQKDIRSLTPNRINLHLNDNAEYKYKSNVEENMDRKYNYNYTEKSQNSTISIMEADNKSLKEQIKSRDKMIITLENQISELRALNKTCYDLLGQVNI